MKTQIAYKILKRSRNVLYSCIIRGICRKLYKKGTRNHPNKVSLKLGYGLMCFVSEDSAVVFQRADCDPYFTEIWEVEIEPLKKQPLGLFRPDELETLKSWDWYEIIRYHYLQVPPGTIQAKSVKLLRKMD